MLGVLAKYFQDITVLRRLLLAVVFLSPELPMFWAVVLEFATEGKIQKSSVTPKLLLRTSKLSMQQLSKQMKHCEGS